MQRLSIWPRVSQLFVCLRCCGGIPTPALNQDDINKDKVVVRNGATANLSGSLIVGIFENAKNFLKFTEYVDYLMEIIADFCYIEKRS